MRSLYIILYKKGGAMPHRSHLSQRERSARSRSTQILHDSDLIVGSLVTMKHTCGKKGCRCARGEKHHSLYLALNVKGKRKMISIPNELAPKVKAAVGAHKRLKPLMQSISDECFKRLVLRYKG